MVYIINRVLPPESLSVENQITSLQTDVSLAEIHDSNILHDDKFLPKDNA